MSPRNESELLEQTIELAMHTGFLVAHFRPARTTQGWRTPVQGHAGVPDLILARDGVVRLAELKSRGEKPRPNQTAWLAALGDHGALWYPQDWPGIQAFLTAPRAGAA